MADIKVYKTLVRNDHHLGGNEFVLGKITGIMYAMCNMPNGGKTFGIADCLAGGTVGKLLMTECTAEEYNRFALTIDVLYQGLCLYDDEL